MKDSKALSPWIKRFLLEHLTDERNLAQNTQKSYRDTIRLLALFLAKWHRKPADQLAVADLSADLLRQFLKHLEEERHCGVATRNQRLAAIHALATFIGRRNPEDLAWCAELRSVCFKKAPKVPVSYLEKDEIEVLLGGPDLRTPLGRRDHAVLLFLYNAGARASEVAQLRIGDLTLHRSASEGQSYVRLLGKGNKIRVCPLWASTAIEVGDLVGDRPSTERVFLNRCQQPLTRFGIHDIVVRYALHTNTSWSKVKKITPHSIRHTTATHLLRSGVDINTIRAWLGHVSLETTNIYAEIDLAAKAKALSKCEMKSKRRPKRWRDDAGLLDFLESL